MQSRFKEVEVFVAKDGTEFFDEEACKEYEADTDLMERVKESGAWFYGAWHLESGQELLDFLKENEELVLELTGWRKP